MCWDAKSDRLSFAKQNKDHIDIDNEQATSFEKFVVNLRPTRNSWTSDSAPWYGGWSERLVGITKTTLKKVLGKSQFNYDVLRTILIEIERVINDRPITFLSSDIGDPEPLTQSHLLQGRRLSQENNSDSEDNNSNLDSTEANKRLNHEVTLIEHLQNDGGWNTSPD
ncbi:unnamed protein product [Mytilus coruscus]|uniref:Integrase catalytic domain-containing protein n=1 Tax=Mytilus coruscus TaxID=42192 RepID=A0A6J8EV05_MYTCO|nr:unnamed protein product [Mytilus coruscus]